MLCGYEEDIEYAAAHTCVHASQYVWVAKTALPRGDTGSAINIR